MSESDWLLEENEMEGQVEEVRRQKAQRLKEDIGEENIVSIITLMNTRSQQTSSKRGGKDNVNDISGSIQIRCM